MLPCTLYRLIPFTVCIKLAMPMNDDTILPAWHRTGLAYNELCVLHAVTVNRTDQPN